MKNIIFETKYLKAPHLFYKDFCNKENTILFESAEIVDKSGVQRKKKAGKIVGYVEARDNEGNTIYIGLYKANPDIKPIIIALATIRIYFLFRPDTSWNLQNKIFNFLMK